MIKALSKKIMFALALLMTRFSVAKAQIFTGGETPEEEGVENIREALEGSKITGTENIGDLILKYVNFALPYLALAAFLGFVYAGFLYVTAYGNDEQVQKSKKIIIYVIVGLILVILSYSIVQLFTGELIEGIQAQ